MAINIPILTEFSDSGIKAAKAAFGNFKTAVADAQGGMGKFKAGSNAALDAVKANAATFAIAAGAAVGKFAIKAIGEFQDLALAAGKFADATGLSVEQASRFIEVGNDIGIEAGTIESGIGKMNKTLGATPELFKELGVDVVRTNSGLTDVNGTFLAVIDRLNKIKDPAQRATVAAKLLGKGWQSMAELINLGSDEIKKSLDSVAGAQVISDEELKKAKEFRDTMDELGDMWNGFVIEAGGYFVNTINGLDSWQGKLKAISPVARVVGFAIDGLTGLFSDNDDQAEETAEKAKRLGDAYAGYVSSRLAEGRQEVALMNLQLEEQAEQLAITDLKWQSLIGTLKLDSAMADAKEQLAALKEKAVEAFGGSEEAVNEYKESLIDAQLMVLALAGTVALTNSQKNQIRILADTGELERALGLINVITAGGYTPELNAMRFRGPRAAGGPVAPGGSYLVGERGPELFTPSSSGNITPNSAMGGGNTITVNVNGGDPDAVVRAIQKYARQNGAIPLQTTTSARF